jgi:hypothetical protein
VNASGTASAATNIAPIAIRITAMTGPASASIVFVSHA